MVATAIDRETELSEAANSSVTERLDVREMIGGRDTRLARASGRVGGPPLRRSVSGRGPPAAHDGHNRRHRDDEHGQRSAGCHPPTTTELCRERSALVP